MISHDHKCIFIHIPRTAGSSIEHMIAGQDWWHEESSTKHLTASQAKRLYADYWHKYFKFSFVRHPVDRVISCLRFADYFGLSVDDSGNINFEEYRRKFGSKTITEFDYRFYGLKHVRRWRHRKGAIYGNILDENLDFVGKYENVQSDIEYIKERIRINSALPHCEKSERHNYHLSDAIISEIHSMYRLDFRKYWL
jgi:hypothetical protein